MPDSQLHFSSFIQKKTYIWRRKWQPIQHSCLENPTDRGAWQAAAHGVTKSKTQLGSWTTATIYMCVCIYTHPHTYVYMGFPDSSVSKESTCNAGHTGSIPGSGRSAGEGIGHPLQYSCLENSMDYTGSVCVCVCVRVRTCVFLFWHNCKNGYVCLYTGIS